MTWRLLFRGILLQGGFSTDTQAFFVQGLATDLLFILPLAALVLLVRLFSHRLALYSLPLLGAVIAAGLIFFAGYFQVFEKPAEFAVAGAGLGTIAGEFFHSALREVSREIALYAGSLLISLLSLAPATRETRVRRSLTAVGYAAPVAGVSAALLFMSFPAAAHREAPQWQGREHMNPFVYAIGRLAAGDKAAHLPTTGNLKTDWRSVSVLNPRRIPAVNVPRRKYNVIFYILESTPDSAVTAVAKGKAVMPHFARLTQNALVGRSHYTQFPLSVNARYSALMSAYNPLNKNWLPLSEPNFPAPTIFEVLKKAGYRTGILHTASLENWNYRKFLGGRQIDFFAEMRDMDAQRFTNFTGFSIDDRAFIAPAVDFVRRSRDTPWFLTFIPVMPHHPYTMPFRELELYSPAEIEAAGSRSERLLRQYYNSLHYADHCLGELVRALEAEGVMDDTLLFVFADHGEAFYQHSGNYLHALELYEENVKVPFLIYNRKLFPRQVVYEGVSRHIDIAPTAVDMVGQRIVPSFNGISLVRAHRSRLAYFHTDWEHDISGVVDGEWKYIYRVTEGRSELYNLRADPAEKQNLAPENRDIVSRLHGEVLAARGRQHSWYLGHRGVK
ncbi:MAG: sulfatase-like hydrolase/transferase [Turneriella sp.]